MNILIISTIDTGGGGARIPWNIMAGLKEKGHKVSMFVGYKNSNDPDVHKIPLNPLYYRLSKFFATDLRFARSSCIFNTKEYKGADVINCHNIHSGFFNWSDFQRIVKEKKVVWTIHDLWPMTSGYTDTYRKKIDEPKRFFGFLWDNRPKLLEEKEKLYKNSFFYTIAVSDYIREEIRQSVLGHLPCRLIYNSVDTKTFKPYNKIQTRKELDLPIDKKIILFVAPKGINAKLKGADYFKKLAKKYTHKKDWLFVAIGNERHRDKIKIENILDIGRISDRLTMAKYYSAADVFLYPSLADSFGLVVAEAMACGLPVVSFDTGGIPGIISDLGYIAKYENLEDLDNGLNKMLSIDKREYDLISAKCAKRIKDVFPLKKMIDRYENLFYEIA